jgi:hypothetical protein
LLTCYSPPRIGPPLVHVATLAPDSPGHKDDISSLQNCGAVAGFCFWHRGQGMEGDAAVVRVFSARQLTLVAHPARYKKSGTKENLALFCLGKSITSIVCYYVINHIPVCRLMEFKCCISSLFFPHLSSRLYPFVFILLKTPTAGTLSKFYVYSAKDMD